MIICAIIDTMLRIVKTKKNSLPFGPNSLKKVARSKRCATEEITARPGSGLPLMWFLATPFV